MRLSAIVSIGLAFVLGWTAPGNVDAASSPSVVMTAPADGQQFLKSAAIVLTAVPTPGTGATVSQVDFIANGVILKSVYTAPWTFTWQNVTPAKYTLVAKVTDSIPHTAKSTPITIYAQGDPPRTLRGGCPPGSALPTLVVESDANSIPSTTGIQKVDFFQNNVLIGTGTTTTASNTTTYWTGWQPPAAGSYTFTAQATDTLLSKSLMSLPFSCKVAAVSDSAQIDRFDSNGVTPATLTFFAHATPIAAGATIPQIEFFQGSTSIGLGTLQRYANSAEVDAQLVWSAVPEGTYSVTVRATDSFGEVLVSPPQQVVVANVAPAPKVSLTTPAVNASYAIPATVPLTASAQASSSGAPVQRVDYYAGSNWIGGSPVAPYTFNWAPSLSGQYYLTAKASDGVGGLGTSAGINVNVDDNYSCKDDQALPLADAGVRASPRYAYLHAALVFEARPANDPDGIRFLARGEGYRLDVTDDGNVLQFVRKGRGAAGDGTAAVREGLNIRTRLLGARAQPTLLGEQVSRERLNFFVGSDPHEWRAGVEAFEKVRNRAVYPGVDQVVYGTRERAEVDYVVAPGTEPGVIRMAIDGVSGMEVDADGRLRLSTPFGTVVQDAPVAYQTIAGRRSAVRARYKLLADNTLTFTLGEFDRAHELVIDPVVVYATYFGGTDTGSTSASALAMGKCGEAVMVGQSTAADLPVTPGVYVSAVAPSETNQVGVVVKMNQSGTGPIFSTFIGGGTTNVSGVAVDPTGAIYITGQTDGARFPTTAGSYAPAVPAPIAGIALPSFLAKLPSNGSKLVYSTYLPGALIYGVAANSAGVAFVTGEGLAGLPTTAGAYDTSASTNGRAFVTKFNAAGSALTYSTYLGGKTCSGGGSVCADAAVAIAVDDAGDATLTGSVTTSDFPTTPGALVQSPAPSANCSFLTKFKPTGAKLAFSTLLCPDSTYSFMKANALALDGSGNAYVAGTVDANYFSPLNIGNVQLSGFWITDLADTGVVEAVLAKIHSDGSKYDYFAEFSGGICVDLADPQCWWQSASDTAATSVAVDTDGSAWVAGSTKATLWSLVNPIAPAGGTFAIKMTPDGQTMKFSSFLTSGTWSGATGIALDGNGTAFITGHETGTYYDRAPFAASPGAYQTSMGQSNADAFILAVNETHDVSYAITASPAVGQPGTTATLTVKLTGRTPSGTVKFMDGVIELGVVDLSSSQASLTVDDFKGGEHDLTVQYSGDRANNPGTSGVFKYVVQDPAPPTTSAGIKNGTIMTATGGYFTGASATVDMWASAGNLPKSMTLTLDPAGPVVTTYNYNSPYPGLSYYEERQALPPLSLGTHVFKVDGTDLRGLTGTSSIEMSVVAPGAPNPTLALTAPLDGASYVSPASITLTAAVTPVAGSTVTNVQYFVNGASVGTSSTGSFSVIWSGVKTGVYTLMAQATAHSTASGLDGIAYSALPVAITVVDPTVPTDGSTVTTVSASPVSGGLNQPSTLFATVAGASPTGTVVFSDNSTPLNLAAPSALVGDTARLAWTPTAIGPHTITAAYTSADQGKNKNSTGSFAYSVGNTLGAPSATLSGIADGAVFATDTGLTTRSGLQVQLGAAAAPGNTISSSKVNLQGGAGTNYWTWSDIGTATFSTPFTLPSLTVGMYTIWNAATDNFGNAATSPFVHFSVNSGTAKPTVAMTAPASGVQLNLPTTLSLKATASEAGGSIASVSFYQGATLIRKVTASPFNYDWLNPPAGIYSIFAVAADSTGNSTLSTPVIVTVNPSPAPTVQITSTPVAGSHVAAPGSITLNVTATAAQGQMKQVDFLQNGVVVSTVMGSPYTYTASNLPAGAYFFTARASDQLGNSTLSSMVGLSVGSDAVSPGVAITSPAPFDSFNEGASVTLAASAFALGTAQIGSVIYFDETGAQVCSAVTSPYSCVMPAMRAGTYSLHARALDNQNHSQDSSEVSFVVAQVAPLQLDITYPIGGATVTDDHVTVEGTLHVPPNSAVTANGVLGTVQSDGTFFVDAVNLNVGNNTIVVSVADPDGHTASQNVVVTSTGPTAFHFLAYPTEGLLPDTPIAGGQPFTVTISTGDPAYQTITRADVLCDDSVVSLSVPALSSNQLITCQFGSPYSSRLRINVYGKQDQSSAEQLVYSDWWNVYGESLQTRNHIVRGVYLNMLARLKRGDTDGALVSANSNAYPVLKAAFLAATPADLVASVMKFGTIAAMDISEGAVQMTLVQPSSTGNRGYTINFIRGNDGIWRIDGI